MERFVYVQQGDSFEKRNVKVGVSDFFYAEIQEGLKAGEVVSLELPKEEREKKAKQLAQQQPGGETGVPAGKPGQAPALNRTNAAPGTAAASPETTPKVVPAAAPRDKRAAVGGKS